MRPSRQSAKFWKISFQSKASSSIFARKYPRKNKSINFFPNRCLEIGDTAFYNISEALKTLTSLKNLDLAFSRWATWWHSQTYHMQLLANNWCCSALSKRRTEWSHLLTKPQSWLFMVFSIKSRDFKAVQLQVWSDNRCRISEN